MSTMFDLKIGGREVALERSETEIAVRPAARNRAAVESQLRDLSDRRPTSQRGMVGGFQIVEISAPGRVVAREREAMALRAPAGDIAPVYYTSRDRVPFVPAGSLYLAFAPRLPASRKREIVAKFGLVVERRERNGAYTVRLGRKEDEAAALVAAIQKEPGVRICEPDLITPRQLMQFQLPSDELMSSQWHLNNSGPINGADSRLVAGADARVVAAWRAMRSLGSPRAVIGVIDDGFDLEHPDLAGKAATPWDTQSNSSDVAPRPDVNDPGNGDWHGTACAGIACGSANKGRIIGAAPLSRMIPVRSSASLDPDELARCFDYMTDNGAWVVSCSWGPKAENYPLFRRVADAISRCARRGREGKGAVIVFAAGNDHNDINAEATFNGFCAHPDVLAVSASTSRDTFADTSNFGSSIALCAPSFGFGGMRVMTSDVDGTYVDAQGATQPMGYAVGAYNPLFSGTSSSCPLVAGVCALVMSVNPGLTAAGARRLLKATARKIGGQSAYDAKGHSNEFGYGCVNAEAAVMEAERLRVGDRVA